ncbi:MAG: prepilin-type N-terminal cleavage/methylation domain-containing protein [Gemmatimonadota bacterium]
MSGGHGPGLRAGMSMLELIIAMTIFSVIIVASMGFFQYQGKAFSRANELMALEQNLRYGVISLEQNLHTLGINEPPEQPGLIYAGGDVLAFNADYATKDPNDAFAVYYDPGLSDSAESALTRVDRFQLPHTSFFYPDTTYQVSDANSPAETIIFFFQPDSTTTRSDDYALYRQVNRMAPELLARNLLRTNDQPFFAYYEVDPDVAPDSAIQLVPAGDLPLTHSVPIHGALGDTANLARIDLVRGVEVRYTTTNGDDGPDQQMRDISRLIRLPNAGLSTPRICGNSPLLGNTAFTALTTTDAEGKVYVELRWNPATDDAGGEKDVVRYVLWRRTSPSAPWGNPFVSVPAGQTLYVLDDNSVQTGLGLTYYYRLAAQDCTPQLSAMALSAAAVP